MDLIKKILITDSDYFLNRGFYSNKEVDPLSANLFIAGDEFWKKLRKKSTPALTTNKIKYVFKDMIRCGQQFKEKIHEMTSLKEILDLKELCVLLLTDMICTKLSYILFK